MLILLRHCRHAACCHAAAAVYAYAIFFFSHMLFCCRAIDVFTHCLMLLIFAAAFDIFARF